MWKQHILNNYLLNILKKNNTKIWLDMIFVPFMCLDFEGVFLLFSAIVW